MNYKNLWIGEVVKSKRGWHAWLWKVDGDGRILVGLIFRACGAMTLLAHVLLEINNWLVANSSDGKKFWEFVISKHKHA